MEERQEKVWRYIQACKGRDKALTSKQLSRLTGMSEREVRNVISDLRRDNYPIASAVHPPYGYYIPRRRRTRMNASRIFIAASGR